MASKPRAMGRDRGGGGVCELTDDEWNTGKGYKMV
jgi:hypothetical protein